LGEGEKCEDGDEHKRNENGKWVHDGVFVEGNVEGDHLEWTICIRDVICHLFWLEFLAFDWKTGLSKVVLAETAVIGEEQLLKNSFLFFWRIIPHSFHAVELELHQLPFFIVFAGQFEVDVLESETEMKIKQVEWRDKVLPNSACCQTDPELLADGPFEVKSRLCCLSWFANLPLKDALCGQTQRVVSIELHEKIVFFETGVLLLFLFQALLVAHPPPILFPIVWRKRKVEYSLQRLPHLFLIEMLQIRWKFVSVIDVNIDDEHSVDAGRQWLEVKIGDIFDFEDDVGGEVVALDALVVDLAVRHMDELAQLFVLRRIDWLRGLARPFPVERRTAPRQPCDLLLRLLPRHRTVSII